MMKRFASVVFLSLLSLGLASRATFGLTIMLDDGAGNVVTITDNTGTCVGSGCGGFTNILGNYDLASGVAGQLVVSGVLGVWTVNVSTGLTKPQMGSATAPSMDLNSVNQSSGAGTMTIKFTDTDFGPATGSFIDGIGGTTVGLVSIDELFDAANGAFTGVSIASISNLGPGAFSATTGSAGIVGAFPFSLTQVVVITHTGAGATSFDYSKEIVPEPASMLLLGSGLAGFGYLRRRVLKS